MANTFKSAMQRAQTLDFDAVMVEQKLNKLFHSEAGGSDRYGLHASSIIASDNDFCLREQVLSLFYVRDTGKEFPTKTLRIFAHGTAIHEKWQKMFEKAGWLKCAEKTHFVKKYDLCYTPDIETNWKGEPIIEIKSENTYAFQKSGNHHAKGETQLNFYLCLRGKEKGYVLVEDKNTQDIKIITVKRDMAAAEKFFDRLDEVQEAKRTFVEDRKMPKRKCANENVKRCLDCAMRSACFNIGIGRKLLPKELRKAAEYMAKD